MIFVANLKPKLPCVIGSIQKIYMRVDLLYVFSFVVTNLPRKIGNTIICLAEGYFSNMDSVTQIWRADLSSQTHARPNSKGCLPVGSAVRLFCHVQLLGVTIILSVKLWMHILAVAVLAFSSRSKSPC